MKYEEKQKLIDQINETIDILYNIRDCEDYEYIKKMICEYVLNETIDKLYTIRDDLDL